MKVADSKEAEMEGAPVTGCSSKPEGGMAIGRGSADTAAIAALGEETTRLGESSISVFGFEGSGVESQNFTASSVECPKRGCRRSNRSSYSDIIGGEESGSESEMTGVGVEAPAKTG